MQETGNKATMNNTGRLTIRISRHRLSFSAIDKSEEAQVRFQPYAVRSGISMAANLREAFKEDSLLTSGFTKILVDIDTPVLMVPIEEFNEDEIEKTYHYTFLNRNNDVILHHVLPELNAVAVYSINKDLKLVLEDHFENVRYIPTCKPVWNFLYARSFSGIHNKLFCYFHDGKMEVMNFDKNRFKFINTFEVKYSKDALYFILFVWKQLGLDPMQDEMYIVGEMQEKEEFLNLMRKYIKRTFSINPVAEFNRAPITQIKMPFDLLTLYIKKQ